MANIEEYIKWRGDITFRERPFNEVDNLIFSEIAYVDLDDVIPQRGSKDAMSMEEAAEIYFSKHTDEELLARNTVTKMAPFLFREAAKSNRFKNVGLGGFVNLIDETTDTQFAVMVFTIPDRSVYIAFRGTDDTIVGWKEDFIFSVSSATRGQKMAADYLNHFGLERRKIRVGGHSKGGNFAVYASAFCNPRIRKKIFEIYSNDGPGFIKDITETDEYKEILPKIKSIVPESSVIGMLLNNEYDHKVIKSSGNMAHQHDPLSWEVLGESFVLAESLSESSSLLDTAITNWISSFDDSEKEEFINTLFNTFSSTGATTFEELQKNIPGNLVEMFKNISSLPKEEQLNFGKVIGGLIKSGADAIKNKNTFSKMKGETKNVDKKRG
ncbi:MAG: DUF2974 domain-containing protein [Eubacterium sp.]|nr:DUF2974 domain-containing protein [Eubacterium sp.]